MRLILMTMLLAGCADDDSGPPDPLASATCGDSWGAPAAGKQCDAACAEQPTAADLTEGRCEVTVRWLPSPGAEPFACQFTIGYGDTRGCCHEFGTDRELDDPAEPMRTRRVQFFVCK